MLLPEVLENVKHPVATVRDAFFQVVAYLPLVLREKFLEFLPRVLPTVLLGLSDEAGMFQLQALQLPSPSLFLYFSHCGDVQVQFLVSCFMDATSVDCRMMDLVEVSCGSNYPCVSVLADHVRHTALKAGQVIVDAHGKSSFMTIIPHLEKSLLDINWRIRLAACQVCVSLLFLLSPGPHEGFPFLCPSWPRTFFFFINVYEQLLGDLLSKQLDLKNKSVEFEDMGELLEERAKHQDDFGSSAVPLPPVSPSSMGIVYSSFLFSLS